MNRLRQRIVTLRQRFNDLESWARIAIIAAVVLVLWVGFQGGKYVIATRALLPLETELNDVRNKIGPRPPALEELEAELANRQGQLEVWKAAFTYEGFPQTEPLVRLITETANHTGIDVKTLDLAVPESVVRDRVEFRTQPVTLSLKSDAHSDLNRFLFLLSTTFRSFRIDDIKLAGFGEEPFAEMTLVFYLAPERLDEDS